jgi:hypothetical protein
MLRRGPVAASYMDREWRMKFRACVPRDSSRDSHGPRSLSMRLRCVYPLSARGTAQSGHIHVESSHNVRHLSTC